MNIGRALIDGCERVASGLLVGAVRFYQSAISPLLGLHCRYEPSCSEYLIQSVSHRGVLRGTLSGLWRICRCHPLARGGYDPVVRRGAPKEQRQ